MEHVLPESPLTAVIRAKGRLTLPEPARKHLSLTEGDHVLVVVGPRTLELIPAEIVDRDGLWSMAVTVRNRIDSAEDDVSSGRVVSLDKPRSLGKAIDSLLLTREFARSYRRLRQSAQAHCERALTRLLKTPASPAVRLRPLLTPAGYHELRVGYSDRAVLRIEGSVAILIDVLSFNEIARLNARAARRVLTG